MRGRATLGVCAAIALLCGLAWLLAPAPREGLEVEASAPSADEDLARMGGAASGGPASHGGLRSASSREAPGDAGAPGGLVRLSGRVLSDAGGGPIAGATVAAWRIDRARDPIEDARHERVRVADATAPCAADGSFSLDLVPDGWEVLASAPDHGSAIGEVWLQAGSGAEGFDLVVRRRVAYRLRVIDEEGRPIEGAVAVEFAEDCRGPVLSRAIADRDGAIAGSAGAGASLLVVASGYVPEQVRVPDDHPPCEVVLRRGIAVGGVVVDRAGAPIPEAEIRWVGDVTRTTRAGPDGRFRFELLDPRASDRGITGFEVRAAGFATTDAEVALGDTAARIVLSRAARVRGTVRFPSGAPAAGARVENESVSDASGAFTLDGIPGGEGEVRAYLSIAGEDGSWMGSASYAVQEGGEATGLVITLECHGVNLAEPGSPLRSAVLVRVTNFDGAPFPGARLIAGCGAGRPRATDVDGRSVATFRAAQGSRCTIGIVPPEPENGDPPSHARRWLEVVTGAAEHPPEVVIALPALVFRVLCIHLPDGAPLAEGLAVECCAIARGISWTDSSRLLNPRHTLRVAEGMPHDILVRVEGRAPFRVESWIPPPEGVVSELRLPAGGTITGRIERPPQFAPEEWGAEVHLRPVSPAGRPGGGICDVRADPDGRFVFRGQPPGRYRIVVDGSDERWTAAREVEVRGTDTVDVGTLVTAAPILLHGNVRDLAGQALAGAWVEPLFGPGLDEEGAATHADGAFQLRLPHVPGRLLVSKRGHGTVSVPLDPDVEGPLVLTLPRPGALRLETAAWDPTSSVYMRFPDDPGPWKPRDVERISEGVRIVRDLAPGDVFVHLLTSRGPIEIPARVVADQETRVVVPASGD